MFKIEIPQGLLKAAQEIDGIAHEVTTLVPGSMVHCEIVEPTQLVTYATPFAITIPRGLFNVQPPAGVAGTTHEVIDPVPSRLQCVISLPFTFGTYLVKT